MKQEAILTLSFVDFSVISVKAAFLSLFSNLTRLPLDHFSEYDKDGNLDPSTVKPMVDGGTEGFKGHSRVILPGITPCFHCTLWLFPPQVTFPLCTLAETPRSPAHCIEYVHLIQWGQVSTIQFNQNFFFFKSKSNFLANFYLQERPGEKFDSDNPDHMKWIYEQVIFWLVLVFFTWFFFFFPQIMLHFRP